MPTKIMIAGVVCLAGALAASVAAAGPREENAVKARRGYYQMLIWDLDPIEQMLKGEIAWAPAAAKRHAEGIAALADFDVDRLFVPETSIDDMKGETRALPGIWRDRDKVARLNEEWRTQAAALVSAADRGQDMFNEELVKLGNACKACHDEFRAKEF